METVAEEEKVFVAVPAEPRAGRSTLSWALTHVCGGGGGATTLVVAHVHVPPQMIPVMGGKFHASKLSPEQVSLFRRIEREKADKMLDDYIHQCSKLKVKCEKLMFEKEDVVSGLVELIGLHGITKLVVSAAADRKYSRKLDRPISKTAAAIMERADPSCKIWFVCKEQLICTRDSEVEIAAAAATASLLPNLGHELLHLSTQEEEDDVEMGLSFYDELKEACKAAENLMNRALNESCRRQKADECLQKAKEYEELYMEEVTKRKELERALARADREIAQLRQAIQQNTTTEESQEAMTKRSILEQRRILVDDDDGGGAKASLAIEHWLKCVQVQAQLDHGNGSRRLEALLSEMKLAASSPSSVIPSPPLDEGRFTYEPDAVRCWLVHQDLTPDFALRAVNQDCMRRQQQPQCPSPCDTQSWDLGRLGPARPEARQPGQPAVPGCLMTVPKPGP